MKPLIIYIVFGFSLSIFGQDDFSNGDMRLIKWYNKGKYKKVERKTFKIIQNTRRTELLSYLFALSNYRNNKHSEISSLELDQTLRSLDHVFFSDTSHLNFLFKNDQSILDSIKNDAESLSEEEWSKRRTKAIRRFERLISFYGDTSEFYLCYIEKRGSRFQGASSYGDNLAEIEEDPIVIENVSRSTWSEVERYLTTNPSGDQFIAFLNKTIGLQVHYKQEGAVKIAAHEYGVAEIEGKRDNKEILKYFKEAGFNNVYDDETPWCSAFVTYCAVKSGKTHPNSMLARSWLNYGEKVNNPNTGDIVIFWRGKKNGWEGHVGFYISEDSERDLVYCLGGNQDGKVCVKGYPKNQVLGYRRFN